MAETNGDSRPNNKLRGGQLQPDGTRKHRYSPELAREILRRIAAGETLTQICADPGIAITRGAVRQWIIDNRNGFACDYMRARQAQAEAWADQLLEIADDERLEPNDRRIRLDVRKWLMARLNAARFGDRVRLAGDRSAPIVHVGVVDLDLQRLTAAERDALEGFSAARLAAAQDVREAGN